MNENEPVNPSEFFLYRYPQGKISIQVILGDETVWLTQRRLSELFGVDVRTINEHLHNIFNSKELERVSTIRNFRIVQKEGNRDVSREVELYNLDVIIAVGYRVNSYQATQFRIWATQILKEYLIKGFALDDERLKQGKTLFGKDYFDELLERIREIRASERRFYQKITDLYALSADYDPNSPITTKFFAVVQNKLEYAITSQTAAEIIRSRASAEKPKMGLTTWKNAPHGKIVQSDVTVAKNYLDKHEIDELNMVVETYLNMAELQAKRKHIMYQKDWVQELDNFLNYTKYEVLQDSGKISKEIAQSFAKHEYEKFRVVQDIEWKSDFDKVIDSVRENKQLPKESHNAIDEKKSDFENVLGSMLKVPPPKKDKK